MASSFVDSHRSIAGQSYWHQCFFFSFLLLLLLLLLQLGACRASVASPASSTTIRHGSSRPRARISTPTSAITALCRTTAYPQQCSSILSTLPPKASLTRQIIAVSAYALHLTNFTYSAVVRDTAKQHSWDQSQISGHGHVRRDKLASGALQDCIDLMGNSMDQLHISISKISGIVIPAPGHPQQMRASHARVMDAQVSLSAAYTFQDTCQDEINGHHDASYAAALLIKQSGPITQTIAVGLSLAQTLQHKILHP